jgi:hypothetical protein
MWERPIPGVRSLVVNSDQGASTVPEEVVEAEVVGEEIIQYDPPPQQVSLFGTNDPLEVVEKATAVADVLKDVLRSRNLIANIRGKDHVQVEGWQLLGSMLGVTAVCVHTDVIDGGFKATVEARTFTGQLVGRADAVCTKYEKSGPWKGADDYARLSMAQTRATSKALKGPLGFIVHLAGYETTPAEEMTFASEESNITSAPADAAPPEPIDWGPDPEMEEDLKNAFKALGFTRGKVRLRMAECQSQEDRGLLRLKLFEEVNAMNAPQEAPVADPQ